MGTKRIITILNNLPEEPDHFDLERSLIRCIQELKLFKSLIQDDKNKNHIHDIVDLFRHRHYHPDPRVYKTVNILREIVASVAFYTERDMTGFLHPQRSFQEYKIDNAIEIVKQFYKEKFH
jgi:hypothetical protein